MHTQTQNHQLPGWGFGWGAGPCAIHSSFSLDGPPATPPLLAIWHLRSTSTLRKSVTAAPNPQAHFLPLSEEAARSRAPQHPRGKLATPVTAATTWRAQLLISESSRHNRSSITMKKPSVFSLASGWACVAINAAAASTTTRPAMELVVMDLGYTRVLVVRLNLNVCGEVINRLGASSAFYRRLALLAQHTAGGLQLITNMFIYIDHWWFSRSKHAPFFKLQLIIIGCYTC